MEKEAKYKLPEVPATPKLLASPMSWSREENRLISYAEYLAAKYPDVAFSLAIAENGVNERIRTFQKLSKEEKLKLSIAVYKSGSGYGGFRFLQKISEFLDKSEKDLWLSLKRDKDFSKEMILMGQSNVQYLERLVKDKRLRRPKEDEFFIRRNLYQDN